MGSALPPADAFIYAGVPAHHGRHRSADLGSAKLLWLPVKRDGVAAQDLFRLVRRHFRHGPSGVVLAVRPRAVLMGVVDLEANLIDAYAIADADAEIVLEDASEDPAAR